MLINKTDGYEDDDEKYHEDDAEWHAGDDDDKPEETAHTGLPKDGPELLDQSDGNLADADASTSQMYVSASRSFSRSTRASVSCQDCPRLPSVLWLLALSLLTACLSHPLVANLQSLEARARSARGRGTIHRTRDHSLQTLVHWSLAKTPTSRSGVCPHQCPRSV